MTAPCPSRDYFPAPIDLILVDAHLLFATKPPEGAATLAEVVQHIVERPPVLAAHVATVGAPAPAVDDLPDPTRDFFNGCTVSFDLPRYEAMVGPLTARPDRSLADVVREVAA